MNDRQWIMTGAFAGIVAAAFMYMPGIGHLYTFIAVILIQAVYLGWQDVTDSQSRLGTLSFALGIFIGMPILALLMTPTGPGNLWGLAALMGIVPGVIVLQVTHYVTKRRSR